MRKINSFCSSFRAAGRGIAGAVRQERNLRFHLVAAVFVLLFRGCFVLTAAEDAVLFLTIGALISAELLNTAIERAVDLCCPQAHPLAAKAKDAAAGAVLALAVAAVGIGIKIFWRPPELMAFANSLLVSPIKILILLLAAALGVWFVFFFEEKPCPGKI